MIPGGWDTIAGVLLGLAALAAVWVVRAIRQDRQLAAEDRQLQLPRLAPVCGHIPPCRDRWCPGYDPAAWGEQAQAGLSSAQAAEQLADDTAQWLAGLGPASDQLSAAQRADAFNAAARADARLIDNWIRAGGCLFDTDGAPWLVDPEGRPYDMPEHRSWDRDWLVSRGLVYAEDLAA